MLHFLGIFNSNTWLSEGLEGIMGAMEVGIRTLSFSLSTIIYGLIIKLYDLFEILCRGRILDQELLKELSTRMGLILGLVMFFNIIFSMIKMLLEPDKMNDKEMGAGAILKKLIIVIIMLGTSNFLFGTLYSVQKIVVESHAISNLLLPYKIEKEGLDSFGKILSSELLLSFYEIEDFDGIQLDSKSSDVHEGCKNSVNSFNNQILNSGKFDLGYNCLNESVKVPDNTGTGAGTIDRDVFIVNYNWIIAPLAGLVAAYLLFMYCFKIGIRMIQLMFLEIISPMAFVSYLSPKKDTMFSKWIKLYVATYIDVFIRVVIINFVIFLIATIFNSSGGDGHFIFWESIGGKPDDFGSASFITVIIVLSLLTFAKKAPDLIKELLPASASKLGFGLSMKDVVGLQKGTKIGTSILGGAAGGAAIGLLGGGLGGFAGGLLKGGFSGLKGQGIGKTASGAWKNQSKANLDWKNAQAKGAKWGGYQLAHLQQKFGMRTAYDKDLVDYNDNKAIADNYSNAKSEAEKEALKFAGNYIHDNGYSLGELAQRKVNKDLSDAERFDAETQYNQLLDAATKFNIGIGRGVKNGKVKFNRNYEFNSIDTIDSNGRPHTTNNLNSVDISSINDENAAIIYNRDYVLRASGAGVTDDALLNSKNAKSASDASKTAMARHSTSKDISRHKANAGK